MKYILVLLLLFVGCTSGGQKEQDLEQILAIILHDAHESVPSYAYHGTKRFVVGKLSKDYRDFQRILNLDWESKYEVHIPKKEGWKELADEAVNIQDENDLVFELGQNGEFFLIPIQESDELEGDEVDGVISISDLAFNEQRNRAVIYVAFICGGECGYGQLYFFSKENQNWKVVGARGFWIAFNPVGIFTKNQKGNYC